MNRTLFMESNMDIIRPLYIGALEPQDVIKSDNGLIATVMEKSPGFYVVNIINGSPFKAAHKEELFYNQSLRRYQIDATNLRKWKRKDK